MTPSEYLAKQKIRIDEYLDGYLLPESEKPESIHKAIRYSVFSGGKRFRAAICIGAFDIFGGNGSDRILPVAAGIELIHTYSLIHDDLPCMDDDDLRRGKPTLHKVYGENIAVLAGDALNALAFDLVAQAEDCRLIRVLSKAIGTEGMIGGQVADVEWEGRSHITLEDVEFIHVRKTARLICASLEMGALLAGVSSEKLAGVRDFGNRIGLAFQIVDDILDIESSDEVLGKTVGSDEAEDKATFPKACGLAKSKEIARELIDGGIGILDAFEEDTSILESLALFVIDRVN